MLQKPKWDANKYDKGHIAIRAGTCGMSGAAVLAAMGALSGGAGLVTLLPDPAVADAVASQVPEAIVRPWEGFLPNKFDVLLVGPGGVEDVPMWDGPLVVDASALKDGEGPAWMSRANAIITPHAGEFSRLFSQKAPRGTQERVDALANHQCGHGGVLVLKGAQTFITGGGSRHLYANPTGHAGLATGGSGDFLAGLLAARYANNPESPLKAAQEAVWLHGAAADKLGKGPLLVRELASSLAGILREKERG
jgi:NAD(P)H-hydrate epimerase